MKLYKLTDARGFTRGNTLWGENVTHTADKTLPPKLCTSGVIHAYTSPELAAFMAPVHVNSDVRTLREARGQVAVSDGTKVGCRSLTTLHVTDLPQPTAAQCVTFGILCALQVCKDDAFREWAENWLSGEDRSAYAAAARAADADAARAAAYAAAAAVYAADAAARAAAYAAADAAAAAAAADAGKKIDFDKLARKAMRVK